MMGKRDWSIHSTCTVSLFYVFLFACFLNESSTGTHKLPKGNVRRVTGSLEQSGLTEDVPAHGMEVGTR